MKAFNLRVVPEGGSDRRTGKERREEGVGGGPRADPCRAEGFFGYSPLFVVVSGSRYA